MVRTNTVITLIVNYKETLKQVVLFVGLALICLPAPVRADVITTYSVDLPPFIYDHISADGSVTDFGSGPFVNIVGATAERAGYASRFAFIPWSRAQLRVQSEKLTTLLPFSRTPVREAAFTWIMPVYDTSHDILTTDPDVALGLENARSLNIAILQSTPQVGYLGSRNFEGIQIITSSERIGRMLVAGRANATMEDKNVARFYYEMAGGKPDDLRVVYTGPSTTWYLAGGLNFDLEVQLKLAEAFRSLKQSGYYDRLLATSFNGN